MKLVLCRLLKELSQVCFACCCCMEAWQRWGDQIKPLINNTLFSKCCCFWQRQQSGGSNSKAAVPATKRWQHTNDAASDPMKDNWRGWGRQRREVIVCLLVMGPIFSAAMPAELQGAPGNPAQWALICAYVYRLYMTGTIPHAFQITALYLNPNTQIMQM